MLRARALSSLLALPLLLAGCDAALPPPAEGDRPALPAELADIVTGTADTQVEPDLADLIEPADADAADTPVEPDAAPDAPADSVADASDAPPETVEPDTAPDVPPLPIACRELVGVETLSGEYTIDPDGAGPNPPRTVYCDMTTDGGGWTLVGRSDGYDDGSTSDFGWSTSYGSPSDFTRPYAFGVVGSGLAFSEILVGSRPTDNELDQAYRLTAPADFLTACAATDCLVPDGPQPVLGPCVGLVAANQPTMLLRVGFTAALDRFHLRDVEGDGPYGLFASGFYLADYVECWSGGGLEDRHGLILVR